MRRPAGAGFQPASSFDPNAHLITFDFMSLGSGTRLGPYSITAPIGVGGMGEVYRASDTRLDREAAIKVLPQRLAEDPQRARRFQREAKAVSSLNHPPSCTVYDVGEENGVHFMVMELLQGETLVQRLEKGALPIKQALSFSIQIADALEKAHREGLIHRDLKPGNIMLTGDGAKLLDFGLAKNLAAPGPAVSHLPTRAGPHTEEGSIVGTFQYMSPEQLEGREADARSDIFSFGIVLYEMIAGRQAFTASSQAGLLVAIMEHQPVPLATLQPLVPPGLDRLIQRCLAKAPDERWQTMSDLASELRWIESAGSCPEPTTPPGRSGRLTAALSPFSPAAS
ncbi:MAG: serine/threonine-protein kinase [Acidobacteriota bacterium]